MTHLSRPSANGENNGIAQARPSAGSEPYVLTLCRLASPVTIRPPTSERLRDFKFFMARSRHADGSQLLQLHMGYFGSMEEAEKWAQALRGRYPEVTAARIARATLQEPGSGVPVLRPAHEAMSVTGAAARAEAPPLTDTQVLRILETRRVSPELTGAGDQSAGGVSLLRADDTIAMRALKQAVVQGETVSFAVQLISATTEINLEQVPSLSIFRAHTLYRATGTREGRTWHCLRLGFFRDAISAKQVAYYVRAHFASVGVVPVTEPERAQAIEHPIDSALLSDAFQRSIDQALEVDRTQKNAQLASPARMGSAATAATALPPNTRGRGSLEETLDMLAASELWTDSESHSETGVRHLKFEVSKGRSTR
jgi:hypothetical protein